VAILLEDLKEHSDDRHEQAHEQSDVDYQEHNHKSNSELFTEVSLCNRVEVEGTKRCIKQGSEGNDHRVVVWQISEGRLSNGGKDDEVDKVENKE
jgi:hypothetical protein